MQSRCGGGCGTHGEDEDVTNHQCSRGDRVSDEGATGDYFPACVAVAGHGRGDHEGGGCGVWRLRSGLVRKRENERLGLGFVLGRR